MVLSLLKPRRRVLLVGDEGIVLFSVTGSKVEKECAIPWDVPNFRVQLYDVLTSQNQRKSVLVLFDVIEQHYKRETLPKVGSLERGKVLKRRLELAYPNYPIRAALELKTKKKGFGAQSKENKDQPAYLFISLPESEYVDIITDVLGEAQVPISGMALLPIESTSLAEALSEKITSKGAKKSRWAVLISQHESGGLRQVVTRDGNLALTRLTPSTESKMDSPDWVEEVTREFKATLSYIARFGYTADDGLDVIVICDETTGQALEQENLPAANFKTFSAVAAGHLVGRKLGRQEPGPQYGDILHSAWAGSKLFPSVKLKTQSLEKIFWPRLMARVAMTGLIIALLGMSGLFFYKLQLFLDLDDEISEKTAQRNVLNLEYEEEAKIFDTLPIRPEVIQNTLAIYDGLEKVSISYNPLLNRLRDTLGPEIEVEQISVTHAVDGEGNARSRSRRISRGQSQPAQTAEKSERGEVSLTLDISFPARQDLEISVQETEAFVERLREAFPGRSVEVTKTVGDATRLGQFSGEMTEEEEKASREGAKEIAQIVITGAPL